MTEHLEMLKQGVDVWNAWRVANPRINPYLYKANLYSANLSGANLSGANLSGANLAGAQFHQAKLGGTDLRNAYLLGATLDYADLSRANFRSADLGGEGFGGEQFYPATLYKAIISEADAYEVNLLGVDLRYAKLSGANLGRAVMIGADLSGADLRGADLGGAYLSQANFVDACLDRAILTDAYLWETQRGGWSIKGIICQRAFWERPTGGPLEPIRYKEGEFERIFAEKPRIVLRYPGGMSPVDLLALPLIVERLQAEHPDSVLQVRSVQNDGGGASVTITVEDRAGRGGEIFRQEMVRIQSKLECVAEERDHLRQLMGSTISQGLSQIKQVLMLPRQETHVHHATVIEGFTMSRDTYNVPGQAGAVGPNARRQPCRSGR